MRRIEPMSITISDTLNKFGNAKILLILKFAFWKVLIAETSHFYTAFIGPNRRSVQFKRIFLASPTKQLLGKD